MPSLLHHNTFGIDAQCRRFTEYRDVDTLRELLRQLRGEKWLHIGGGSNLLFVGDYDGVVLHSLIDDCETVREEGDTVWVRAGAGLVWDDFVAWTVVAGLHGLENLSLIPGEVGASAVQNIGAYGVEAGDFIDTVEVVDTATGERSQFPASECRYAYRNSLFKHEWKGKYVVTHVTYRLSRTFSPDLEYAAIRRAMEERGWTADCMTAGRLRALVMEIRKAKLPDPAVMGSAGSFFMNPVVSEDCYRRLAALYPQMPHYPAAGGVKIPAGWLIEQCGWKGKSMGRAGVYARQALVLVNLGGATGEDIARLSDAVCADVEKKFGIRIVPEANFIS